MSFKCTGYDVTFHLKAPERLSDQVSLLGLIPEFMDKATEEFEKSKDSNLFECLQKACGEFYVFEEGKLENFVLVFPDELQGEIRLFPILSCSHPEINWRITLYPHSIGVVHEEGNPSHIIMLD